MNSDKQTSQDKAEKYTATVISDENPPKDSNNSEQSDKTIIATKEFKEYISKKEELYNTLMTFIENSEDNDFQHLIDLINHQNQDENREKYEEILQLIASISDNCHRNKSFFNNLYQIIDHYKNQIKQTFSNEEIFDIFEKKKKMLLFLFQNKIITIDDDIYYRLLTKGEANGNRYIHFFYPEIKKFIDKKKVIYIKEELINIDENIFDGFEEKHNEGENDSFICSLIREDSVEEFIEYVNRSNISLRSQVSPSIFETNSFLIENNKTTLIEYSAFFGAIQIFQYLRMNGVELNPSLWLYAIHSRNAELIHLLESCQVSPPNENYEKCLYESIKCHHNEIAYYIENNLITEDNDETRKSEEFISTILKNHNYAYLNLNFEDSYTFFYLWNYGYHTLVNLFIETRKEYYEKVTFETMSDSNLDKLFLKMKKCFKTMTSDTIVTLQEAANKNQIDIIYYLLLCKKSIPDSCFNENSVLQKIVIPSSVVSIGNFAFSDCKSLSEIIIPSSVTSIGESAFINCKSLTSFLIPSSVVSIEYSTFNHCESLREIIIPSSVTSIGNYAFYECVSLKKVKIEYSVTSIGKFAFGECTSLEDINIPSSVTSIGDSAFYKCSSFVYIDIPSSVTSIGDSAFKKCSSMNVIDIPYYVTSIGDSTFAECYSLRIIRIPSSVTSIGDCAFLGIRSLIIKGSIKKILPYMFSYCHSLKNITIPSSVFSIEKYAFCSCKYLKTIKIPSSVVSIDKHAFDGCSALKQIEIPTSLKSIEDYVFNECSSLTEIKIPFSVKSIGSHAFSSCISLKVIEIPSSVVSIDKHAFDGCSALTQIEIPTSLKSIEDYVFNGCSSLAEIKIPFSVKSIGSNAFSGCTSLKVIDIPFSVVSIGDYAFRGCSKLYKYTIPPSVTSIGDNIFDECLPFLQKSFASFLASFEKRFQVKM